MDTEYLLDPRIPRLKKRHKIRTTEDFEENHKAYYDQEPKQLHELMSTRDRYFPGVATNIDRWA